MIRIALLLAMFGQPLAAQSGFAQGRPAAQGSGRTVVVQGRVLTADEAAAPLRRALVTVTSGGIALTPVFADEQGRFDLRVRSSAPYTISVTKAGFAPLAVSLVAPASAGTIELRVPRGGVIAGRVMDAAGRPVVGAGVRTRRLDGPSQDAAAPSSNQYVQTDDLGEYRVASLAPGRYEVHTFRGIDADSAFHGADPTAEERLFQLRRELLPRSVPMSEASVVDVRSGQETALTLVHAETAVILPYATVGGAVTGVVTDEWGEPAEGLTVRLWQIGFVNGRREARAAGPSRLTDDRGRYRLFHVPAGRYLVVATDDSARDAAPPGSPSSPSIPRQPFASASSYAPVYYPGRTSIADASVVQVPRASEVSGIDMAFSRTREARVFGVATNATGRPVSGFVTLTLSHRSGAVALPVRRWATDDNGAFEFSNVPPGEYVVRTSGGPEFGLQYVTVSGADVGPVMLRSLPTAVIRGRVSFEGDRSVSPSQFQLKALAADGDSAPNNATGPQVSIASINRDGAFELQGLAGPTRIALANAPPGWWIKSVDVGSINAARDPVTLKGRADSRDDVTVVVSGTGATLGGRVVDERSRPVSEYWALAFASDPGLWFLGSAHVRVDYARADGRFRFAALPPGDYLVAAIDSVEGDSVSGDWQNPSLLSDLVSSASRITLSENEQATTEVRLVRIAR